MDTSIEKALFPESNELHIDEDGIPVAHIVDENLDPIDCTFMNDGSVTIHTETLSYIDLSRENLCKLLELFDAAQDYWQTVEHAENTSANHRK